MKKKISVFFAVVFAISLVAFVPKHNTNDPWPVPDAAKNKANPVKADAASIATGKDLYNTHCKSCHGTKGKGDGPKASQLDTECGDFTKDMPSFKKKITDPNGMWAVVNYLRTLK
jgi:mono/diheme cytochrome c family protein